MGDTTVRLDDTRYSRLEQLAATRHTTPERALAELVDEAAPCAPSVPRQRVGDTPAQRGGNAIDRLAQALGWESVPQLTDAERAEFRAKQRQAAAEAQRIYGDQQPTD